MFCLKATPRVVIRIDFGLNPRETMSFNNDWTIYLGICSLIWRALSKSVGSYTSSVDLWIKLYVSSPMHWSQTRPGEDGIKFHFVLAASSTSCVSMFNLSLISDISFMKAMFTSLCVFSIIFAASAILMEDVLKRGAVTTL